MRIFNYLSDLRNSVFKGNFTPETMKRMKKQKKKLVNITKNILDEIIKGRDLLVSNVFKHDDSTRVYLPVNFNRIINNIQYQLEIQSNSLMDITPYEMYELIEKGYENLKMYYSQTFIIISFSLFILSFPTEFINGTSF